MEVQDRGERPALSKTLARLLPPPEVATEAQTFRLFDLPDELWLRIGRMVINDEPAINIRAIWTKPWTNEEIEMNKIVTLSAALTPPAVLQTCAALRKELRNRYYREKVTVTASYAFGPHTYMTLDRYLRMIGPAARGHIHVLTAGAEGRRGAQRGRLRPPPFEFEYWEWEMMFTPTRVAAAHGEVEDQDLTEWEITFL